jgi:hypothetical protein
VIIGFKDPEALLYHYTSMRVAREHIIPSRTLRMGNFRRTNDPKESKNWEFNLGTNQQGDMLKYNQAQLSRQLSNAFKDHAQVLCLSRDTGPLTGDHLREIAQRGFAKPRMWAQYAERHTGVCLAFDRKQLDRAVAKASEKAFAVYCGNITYRDHLVVPGWEGDYVINVDELERRGFDRYWRDHIETFKNRLLFEKMQDWKDEREFRYVAFLDDPGDVFVDITEALVGVFFADGADDREVDALIELLLPTKVQMMGLKWKNCSPWYDFGNFKYDRQLRKSPWFEAQKRAPKVG